MTKSYLKAKRGKKDQLKVANLKVLKISLNLTASVFVKKIFIKFDRLNSIKMHKIHKKQKGKPLTLTQRFYKLKKKKAFILFKIKRTLNEVQRV